MSLMSAKKLLLGASPIRARPFDKTGTWQTDSDGWLRGDTGQPIPNNRNQYGVAMPFAPNGSVSMYYVLKNKEIYNLSITFVVYCEQVSGAGYDLIAVASGYGEIGRIQTFTGAGRMILYGSFRANKSKTGNTNILLYNSNGDRYCSYWQIQGTKP